MGPYVLATQLRKAGFSVVVIDYFTRIPHFFEYIEKFIDHDTLFVGLSTTFLSHTPSHERFKNQEYRDSLLKYHLYQHGNNREENKIKYENTGLWLNDRAELNRWLIQLRELLFKYNPAAKIILGGAKANLLLRDSLIWNDIDYYALSASDVSLVDFALNLRQKLEPIFFDHKGHRVLDNRQELKEKNCPETVLEAHDAIMPHEALPIEISRGCIYSCKYCHYDKKESYRKNLDILKQEFIRNYEKFGSTVYHFCDDCFNDARRKVEETCNLILSLPFKIEWISYARVDIGLRFPETLDLMVESGASGLFFGLESFNFEAAKNAGKKIPPEEVKNFLTESYNKHKERCLFEASFIVGLPHETTTSLYETMKWVIDHKALDFINVAPLYLQHFEEKLDKVSMDYAEFSRNPSVFGITKSNENLSWSHATMDSDQASKLTVEFLNAWTEKKHRTIFRNVFDYPILRTLGFSKSEIFEMGRNEQKAFEWGSQVMSRFESFKTSYWDQLLKYNSKNM